MQLIAYIHVDYYMYVIVYIHVDYYMYGILLCMEYYYILLQVTRRDGRMSRASVSYFRRSWDSGIVHSNPIKPKT